MSVELLSRAEMTSYSPNFTLRIVRMMGLVMSLIVTKT